MTRHLLLAAGFVALTTVVGLRAQPVRIVLPPDTSQLRSSDLPGYVLAQQKCLACHSADYISYQPPNLTLAQWTAEVTKMRQVYGAPLEDAEIPPLGAYFAVAYGGASKTDPAVLEASGQPAAPPPAAEPGKAPGGTDIDVKAVLAASGCLVCHAVDKPMIGPAFQAIARKYDGVADAWATVATSIRQGGVGKWGQIPMPAMPHVTEAQADAIAGFVLAQ